MCATVLQSHYLCKILCPPHVSYHELVSMPADSHHKLGLVLDVLILGILHVLQMCDSHKRQSNSQRRISCDTISRAPIFMRLPAPVLQTLYRLRPASAVASCQKCRFSVCRDCRKFLSAEKTHSSNEVVGFWLVSISIG